MIFIVFLFVSWASVYVSQIKHARHRQDKPKHTLPKSTFHHVFTRRIVRCCKLLFFPLINSFALCVRNIRRSKKILVLFHFFFREKTGAPSFR